MLRPLAIAVLLSLVATPTVYYLLVRRRGTPTSPDAGEVIA
jgi:hypothetical protein